MFAPAPAIGGVLEECFEYPGGSLRRRMRVPRVGTPNAKPRLPHWEDGARNRRINARLRTPALYIDGLLAFSTGGYFELHSLTIFQGLETLLLDRTVVHEKVLTALWGDKTKALPLVKPLYLACSHVNKLLHLARGRLLCSTAPL